jgi:hypothetical protein
LELLLLWMQPSAESAKLCRGHIPSQRRQLARRFFGRPSRGRPARHFKPTLAKAESQPASDRAGVIHVGIESRADPDVDARRHTLNVLEPPDPSEANHLP